MGTRQLRHPIAPRHWPVIAIVLFVMTFALGFLVRLVPAIGTAQLPLDVALNRQHSDALDAFAGALDHLDQPVVVAAILLVMFAVLWLLKDWRTALITCIVAGAGWVSCLAVKYIVHEPRPVIADLPHSLNISPSTLSFPSGHVALVAAFATALFLVVSRRASRVTIVVVFALLALFIGASRLYIGVHYLTDTIGGALNGVAGAVLVAGLISLVVRRVSSRTQ